MLTVRYSSPYGRLGTLLSALIVVSCVIGLTMHRDFYSGKRRRDFSCFYTNLSNLVVLLYFSLIAPHLYARKALRTLIPHAEFAVMMSIMLTFSVFHLLLFPSIRARVLHMPHTRAYRIVCADNFIIHYLVPWLVFFYWLLCSPQKQALRFADAFVWTAAPTSYILYMALKIRSGYIIEETNSPYPYPFLDTQVLGIRRVAQYCASLYALGVLTALILLVLLRGAYALLGGGHTLILI